MMRGQRERDQPIRLRTATRRVGDERGSMSLMVASVAIIGFLLLGLVVDGGQIRNGRRQAGDIAQEAARAGAQRVNPGSVLLGTAPTLDVPEAQSTARAYLAAAGVSGTATASGDTVTVTVNLQVDLFMLDAAGQRQVSATRVSEIDDGT